MADYSSVPGLDVYLFEETYVLDLDVHEGRVALEIDAALTLRHPRYDPPEPDEQFCYRRGRLSFRSPSDVVFAPSGAPAARDAAGEFDYGAIDAFVVDAGHYHLEGEFGAIDLTAEGVDVVLHD